MWVHVSGSRLGFANIMNKGFVSEMTAYRAVVSGPYLLLFLEFRPNCRANHGASPALPGDALIGQCLRDHCRRWCSFSGGGAYDRSGAAALVMVVGGGRHRCIRRCLSRVNGGSRKETILSMLKSCWWRSCQCTYIKKNGVYIW